MRTAWKHLSQSTLTGISRFLRHMVYHSDLPSSSAWLILRKLATRGKKWILILCPSLLLNCISEVWNPKVIQHACPEVKHKWNGLYVKARSSGFEFPKINLTPQQQNTSINFYFDRNPHLENDQHECHFTFDIPSTIFHTR